MGLSPRNEGIWKNKPFYIGAVSALDGHIEEVHTYEEAARASFHHWHTFSPDVAADVSFAEALLFIIKDGRITFIDRRRFNPETKVVDWYEDPEQREKTFQGMLCPDIESQIRKQINFRTQLKKGNIMALDTNVLTDALAKTARVLAEDDRPNPDQDLQIMVGDPDDARSSTFSQFKPNPGSMQLPNPLSPVEGDEIFFAYLMPWATFAANDGTEWNILEYSSPDQILIENRWYPRISSYVSIGDIRRSIHAWIEPVQEVIPPPPPGVDYSALPVKVMDEKKNKGDIDAITDYGTSTNVSGW